MKTAGRAIAALALPLVITLGGCGFFGSGGDSSSEYNRGKLCDEFAEFFKNELSVNVEYSNRDKFNESVGWANGCNPVRVPGGRIGQLSMVNLQGEGAENPDDPSFQPQKGFDEKVWMTTDNSFRVEIGSWIGRLELYQMKLTDDQTRKTIEFLIRTTREVRG